MPFGGAMATFGEVSGIIFALKENTHMTSAKISSAGNNSDKSGPTMPSWYKKVSIPYTNATMHIDSSRSALLSVKIWAYMAYIVPPPAPK